MTIELAMLTVALPVVMVLLLLLYLLRKITRSNEIVRLNESQISWEDVPCPRCQAPMAPGYAMAGRGVIWRAKGEKWPGTFATIMSVLPNTMSFNAPPALNLSWRCDKCNIVALDHAKMVKVKKD